MNFLANVNILTAVENIFLNTFINIVILNILNFGVHFYFLDFLKLNILMVICFGIFTVKLMI